MLADERNKRVVIIDTSNEIGGDGDVPHFGIGCARRMQVPNVHMQHNVSVQLVSFASSISHVQLSNKYLIGTFFSSLINF